MSDATDAREWYRLVRAAVRECVDDWTEAIRAAQARSPCDLMPQSSEAGQ